MLAAVLSAANPRPTPDAKQEAKNKYASRFADRMADHLAKDLAPRLKGLQASAKRAAGSLRGQKQLDVNFSTPQHGLALGISLKSVHLREVKDGVSGRYTHNMKRNEEELRIEASGYHKRQPYAVMVGVLFLPFDSCDDAKKTNPSSFGSWVRHLRPYCGRSSPDGETDRFEKMFIALYEPNGAALRFFDVASDPPKSGRPKMDGELYGSDSRASRLLTYEEYLDDIHQCYLERNHAEFRWADGVEEPLEIADADEGVEGERDEELEVD